MEKERVYYHIDYKETLDFDQTLKEWQKYSDELGNNFGFISINQEEDVVFYQTRFDRRFESLVLDGRLPKNQNEYLSNQDLKSTYHKVGTINIPEKIMRISVFPLQQAKNNGLSNIIFMDGTKKEIRQTKKFLENYGKITPSNFAGAINLGTPMLLTLAGLIFLIVLYLTVLFFKVEKRAKKIAVLQILGKSKKEAICPLVLEEGKLLILSIVISFLSVYGCGFFFKSVIFASSYFYSILLALGVGGFLLLFYQLFLSMKFKNKYHLVAQLKGKQLLRKISILNCGLFIILISIIIVISGGAIQTIQELQLEKKNFQANNWKRTKHIYRLAYRDDVKQGDTKNEFEVSKNMVSLYNKLVGENKGFMIEARNFDLISKHPYRFSFEDDVKTEEDLYSTSGNTVLISPNYLLYNPIKPIKKINELTKSPDNTLTALVPEKLKVKDKVIRKALLNDFYLQKIDFKNTINSQIGGKEVKQKKSDLKINLIYVDNNQSYFTFSSKYGVPSNGYKVIDPIAVIINPTIEELFTASYMTSCMFIKDESNTDAYSHLKPLLYETKTAGNVVFLNSIYKELGETIHDLTTQLTMAILILISGFVFLSILIVSQLYLYYQIYYKKIQVKQLLGYSWLQIHPKFLSFVTITTIFISLFAAYGFQNAYLVILGCTICVFEWMILLGYIQFLGKRALKNFKQEGA
ncbi:hypothetical protein ACYRFS_03215 [Listeria kieliensis]